jgi:hypothetical protein
MALDLSKDQFWKVLDEVIDHNGLGGLSPAESRALSIYITEKRRGGDIGRTFEYTHPKEYALFNKIVADFAPRARTMSELAASRISESDRRELYARSLEADLHRLAEATGDEPRPASKPDGWLGG